MTATVLDPRTALIVVDLQKGIASFPFAPPIVVASARLADAFRDAGLPVVLVNVTGGAPGRVEAVRPRVERPADWADLVPELHPESDGTLFVTKKTWGAFHGTDLHEQLQAAGVTQVVVTGIATAKGVESTARAAHEHGYNVTVATDAVGDMDPIAHANAIERIFPAIGETGTVDELIALLSRPAA